MKKLVLHMESLESETKDVFHDSFHEDLVAHIKDGGEYDDMEVKGMEITLEQLAEDINFDLAENEKVGDVAENLSDTANVLEASGSDTITPTEAQLMAVSANMGVAGSQNDASDLAPSMEAFKDKALAMQQLREKNRIATEGILESLKVVGEKISNLIKGLFSLVTKLEARIKSIKSLVASLSDKKQKEVTVKVKNSVFLRSGDGKYVKNAEEYKSLLTETVSFYGEFSKSAITSVNIFGDSYKKWWTTIGKKNNFETTSGLYQLYMDSVKVVANLPGMKQAKTNTPNVKFYKSKPLLGSAEVQVNLADDVDISEENIPKLKTAIYNSGFSIGRWWGLNPDEEDKDYQITFNVNQQYLIDIVKQSELALSIFKNFLNETYKANVKKISSSPKHEFTSSIMSFHTLVLNHGTNHYNFYISYAKRYSQLLTTSSLDLVEKLAKDKAWDAEAKPA